MPKFRVAVARVTTTLVYVDVTAENAGDAEKVAVKFCKNGQLNKEFLESKPSQVKWAPKGVKEMV